MSLAEQIEALYARFGAIKGVTIELYKRLIAVTVKNEAASATVFLQGAQLARYCRIGQPPLIWLSNLCRYQAGQPLRGGIPVCWPWFGDDTTGLDRPAHGFARTHHWHVADSGDIDQGHFVTLQLTDTESTLALWPYRFNLTLTVTLTEALTLSLTTTNLSEQVFELSQALHSYFHISDIAKVSIKGLANHDYLDKLSDFSRKTQQGDLTISQEVDRIYCDTQQDVVLNDQGWQRQLNIAAKGSQTTVVWNPWQDASEALSDLAEDDYRQFLCIETANAADDKKQLEPGESHTLTACYQIS